MSGKNERSAVSAAIVAEWDEETNDGHCLRLTTGCMTFEVDLDGGVITLETDTCVSTPEKLTEFCAAIVKLYNDMRM